MKKEITINQGGKVSFVKFNKKMDAKVFMNETVYMLTPNGFVTKYGFIELNNLVIPAEEGLNINGTSVPKDTVLYFEDVDNNAICGKFKGYFPGGDAFVIDQFNGDKSDLTIVRRSSIKTFETAMNVYNFKFEINTDIVVKGK